MNSKNVVGLLSLIAALVAISRVSTDGASTAVPRSVASGIYGGQESNPLTEPGTSLCPDCIWAYEPTGKCRQVDLCQCQFTWGLINPGPPLPCFGVSVESSHGYFGVEATEEDPQHVTVANAVRTSIDFKCKTTYDCDAGPVKEDRTCWFGLGCQSFMPFGSCRNCSRNAGDPDPEFEDHVFCCDCFVATFFPDECFYYQVF